MLSGLGVNSTTQVTGLESKDMN